MKTRSIGKQLFFTVTFLFSFIIIGLGNSCSTAPVTPTPVYTTGVSAEVIGVPWAEYTQIPNKDYRVIGAVVLRNVNRKAAMYDLMDQVIKMGGHDVINIRMSVTPEGEITNATAVVIKYTEETLDTSEGYILFSDLSRIEIILMGYGDSQQKRSDEIVRAPWSGQNTLFPNKDYVVLGAIGLRETSSTTVLADLMDQALEMGAHDIINVRLGISSEEKMSPTNSNAAASSNSRSTIVYSRDVNNATAVAIRYTDENVKIADIRPVMSQYASVQENTTVDAVAAPKRRIWPWILAGVGVLLVGIVAVSGF